LTVNKSIIFSLAISFNRRNHCNVNVNSWHKIFRLEWVRKSRMRNCREASKSSILLVFMGKLTDATGIDSGFLLHHEKTPRFQTAGCFAESASTRGPLMLFLRWERYDDRHLAVRKLVASLKRCCAHRYASRAGSLSRGPSASCKFPVAISPGSVAECQWTVVVALCKPLNRDLCLWLSIPPGRDGRNPTAVTFSCSRIEMSSVGRITG
jgi:hypothetical protein